MEKGAGAQIKTPTFSTFLGQTGGEQDSQHSREGNPSTLGAVFHGAPAKFEVLPPVVLKLLFLRLKIYGFIPSFPKRRFSYSDRILTAPSVQCLRYLPDSLNTSFKG